MAMVCEMNEWLWWSYFQSGWELGTTETSGFTEHGEAEQGLWNTTTGRPTHSATCGQTWRVDHRHGERTDPTSRHGHEAAHTSQGETRQGTSQPLVSHQSIECEHKAPCISKMIRYKHANTAFLSLSHSLSFSLSFCSFMQTWAPFNFQFLGLHDNKNVPCRERWSGGAGGDARRRGRSAYKASQRSSQCTVLQRRQLAFTTGS